jgi:hypothetical protein
MSFNDYSPTAADTQIVDFAFSTFFWQRRRSTGRPTGSSTIYLKLRSEHTGLGTSCLRVYVFGNYYLNQLLLYWN